MLLFALVSWRASKPPFETPIATGVASCHACLATLRRSDRSGRYTEWNILHAPRLRGPRKPLWLERARCYGIRPLRCSFGDDDARAFQGLVSARKRFDGEGSGRPWSLSNQRLPTRFLRPQARDETTRDVQNYRSPRTHTNTCCRCAWGQPARRRCRWGSDRLRSTGVYYTEAA